MLSAAAGGCATSRVYDTSETALLKAIPAAAASVGFQGVEGHFNTASRTYFVDANLIFGFGYKAMRITWEPMPGLGRMVVTADAYGGSPATLYLWRYDDPDMELEFHRQLAIALGRP